MFISKMLFRYLNYNNNKKYFSSFYEYKTNTNNHVLPIVVM